MVEGLSLTGGEVFFEDLIAADMVVPDVLGEGKVGVLVVAVVVDVDADLIGGVGECFDIVNGAVCLRDDLRDLVGLVGLFGVRMHVGEGAAELGQLYKDVVGQ